ncbi:DUF5317 domain-containing protein [Aquibacillus rhizosphaerae]|uniref:DUF5317 domain-containing protein n=1 Tax=Aquibacillus rhizosphaerae TaxID=3051431 RepID=A0ABT7L3K1_9BACI|nr:DUF5317 domain-containing protein [Aquibacillus sp. LR5S19]MDL4840446.1 DUF5317 domain-containing protein [Aquibacillus sp. LR5S19]
MVYDGILLSIIIGFFRKGNLKFLAKPIFKWGWIFPILLFVQILTFYFQNKIALLGEISNYIFIFIYMTGLFFLWVNRHQPGMNLLFVGVLLNFIVMAINGGRMPVSEEASIILDPMYIEAIKDGFYGKHALLTESTKLAFLGDIIPITSPYPRSQVISIGDVIMNIGIFLFIQNKMLENKDDKKKVSSVPSETI